MQPTTHNPNTRPKPCGLGGAWQQDCLYRACLPVLTPTGRTRWSPTFVRAPSKPHHVSHLVLFRSARRRRRLVLFRVPASSRMGYGFARSSTSNIRRGMQRTGMLHVNRWATIFHSQTKIFCGNLRFWHFFLGPAFVFEAVASCFLLIAPFFPCVCRGSPGVLWVARQDTNCLDASHGAL